LIFHKLQHYCSSLQENARKPTETGAKQEFRRFWEAQVLAEERQNKILSLVKSRHSISITEIQKRLKVSRETIRRDLLALAEQRKLRKTHGGAISLNTQEPDMAVRQTTNVVGKRAIGRLAASMVPDGASIILAGGTTVQSAAEELAQRERLTVFTNCLATSMKLSSRNNNRVHLLGGEIQPENRACLGRDTTLMLSNYFADFAIVGAGAISPGGVLMDFSREEAELHSLMLKSAQNVIVVADHNKFGRYAPVRVDSLEAAHFLVTDRDPEADIAELLSAMSLELLVADTAAPEQLF
jgi:DeoR family transcriptional regulator, glycerol-3-phosphate regulon repressor